MPVDRPLPIVFVHGIRVSRAIWHPIRGRLDRNIVTIAPDLPGHGQRRDDTFSLDAAVNSIGDAIVTRTETERAMVIGHSLGGYVAMALAARHPERVEGLVLAGCTTNPMGLWGRSYMAAIALLSHVPPERLNQLSRWRFRRQFPPQMVEPIVAAGFHTRAMRSTVASIIGHDFLQMLQTFPKPVQFINGSRDWPFRLHEAAFCQASHHSSLLRFKRAGHIAFLVYPDAFTRAVQEFHHRLSGRPSAQ